MGYIDFNGQQYEVDEDGFLADPTLWTRELAVFLAKNEEVELTDEHWKIIDYLVNYYKQFGIAPMVRKMVKDTGFSVEKIYELFPSGPGKGACKIAGIPKPTGCV
ncbi:TusE/DsrC/DsvC family sulfur relay protein [Candidatus Formimonas warabiya]|uniref:Sulfurtransferase TusE n=1 Tax=Formimonas warabiya TaxID=1761012 RepID=A0A3G1KY98_FORW1|nr:TusE/DsrC/DsvC family sulfur relay protein [Candidatus Formimonas warabiya]ATW27367.1 sulfurtransferase TusE [Candidatus Formimonas warabiya]